MRKLNTDDLFLLSAIIDRMDIEMPKIKTVKRVDDINKTKEENDGIYIQQQKEAQEQLGAELMMLLVRKMHKAKDEIKELITNVTGKDANELSFSELKDAVIELMKQEGFMSFFK